MNKFYAKKTYYKGLIFDSKKEANYCKQLDILKNATGNDKVLKYELQKRYNIIVNGKKIGFYKLDFKVWYPDRVEYIDTKGYRRGDAYQLFRLKKKLVEALFDIKIIEK